MRSVGDYNGDGFTDVIAVGNHNYSDSNPGVISFGIACDRSAHWDIAGGGFPDSIYDLQSIGLGGRTDIVVEDAYDLVVYKLDP
jgi:FG-GAP repeat